jgi:hypothetical protein
MKSKLLARPNLKLFLLAALLIAVGHDLISNGQSETSILTSWTAPRLNPEQELQQLLARAEKDPTPELYGRISDCFEKRGDHKNARRYARRAEVVSEFEE